MKKLTDEVAFGFVRYANVWEDANILTSALQPKPGSRILSIASAGDNCFALLACDPEIVVAADLNPAQLCLIELKKIAIKHLEYRECLKFLGFEKSNNRAQVYGSLKHNLSNDARTFWDENLKDIESGVIHAGKFERYFRLFAYKILPFIHRKSTVAALLSHKTAQEQQDFYHNHWNTWRWRLLFKIFFGRWVMGRLGRDPAFLNQVKLSVGDYIFQKAETHLCSIEAQNNHILRYNLTGNFGHLLPDYLSSEHRFVEMKKRINRVVLFKGFAQEAGAQYGPFDAMNLSDIFEYMDENTFATVGQQLTNIANPGCRFAYWNLMTPRRLSEVLGQNMHYNADLSQKLTAEDRGFFYNQIIVEQWK
jgi:S-adenosylmethionine-diacylglycerol 3-amino-3-carboxypropyl transferase